MNPADTAIMTVALVSDTLAPNRLADLADTILKQRLSQVSGVGHVTVQGHVRPAVRIQADLSRLASHGLTLQALRGAIAAANVSGSKGSLDGAQKTFTIGANDQLADAASYLNLVVAQVEGVPVFLQDVATVVDGIEDEAVAVRYDGRPAVILDVARQPGANIVATVDDLRALLPSLEQLLPVGVRLTVVSDRTTEIRAAVHDVQLTLLLAVGLVVLVVLLFLRTASATLVAGITLPLSIIATFSLMWWAGFSLDTLSLMALTIATGFVVDDAIVMIENISRHRERGLSALAAARRGAGEIGFTIVSLTASLVAVFIPLLFMSGVVGRLFREFALTLTMVVVVSAVIALTLTPMLCALLLAPARDHGGGGRLARLAERPFEMLLSFYRLTLDWTLRHRPLILLSAVLTLCLTVWLYVIVPKSFLPTVDSGLVSVTTAAAQDVSFAQMDALQAQAEAILCADPDVLGVVSVLGVGEDNPSMNMGHLNLVLRPKQDRAATQAEIVERLRTRLAALPGLTASFRPVVDIQIDTRRSDTPYQYLLVDPSDDQLGTWAPLLLHELRQLPELDHVVTDLQDAGPRLSIEVDRVAAGRLGVSMQDVADALYDAFGQRQVSTIYGQSNLYRVVLEAAPRFRTDPSALQSLYVRGSGAKPVPLASFARARPTTAPAVVNRVDQFPAAAIGFDLAPGVSLEGAVAAIREAHDRLGVPSSLRASFTGRAQAFDRSLATTPWLILAAIVAIYIVLGVLYESLIHPFTILSTLPSAGVGALLALLLSGMELSLVGIIGIVLLMGIVKKNAIIMIDFALEAERQRGMAPVAAIREACLLRFRPITMTTLAALLGALPLVLTQGAGSELRVPLGVTIIGGLVVSQVLTLYTTPVIYLAMDGLKRRFVRRAAPDAHEAPPRSTVERLARPRLEAAE